MMPQFIRALLKAPLAKQAQFFAKQIPLGVFPTHLAEITWVYRFRDSNGKYPSTTAFRSRFPEFEWPSSNEPLEELLASVLDTHIFNQLTSAVESARELYGSGRNISEVVEHLRTGVANIRLMDNRYTDSTLSDRSVFLAYKEKVRRLSQGTLRAPSPWSTLNELLGYDEPGETNVIAARTSIGKTWVLLAWASHHLLSGERVLVISKELPTRQIRMRMEALEFKLSYPRLRRGSLSPVSLKQWILRRKNPPKRFENLVVSGNETIKGVGFEHITQKIQEVRPTVLMVDGAYLIYPAEKTANDVARFAMISATLKRLALAFNLRVYMTIQAKRDSEDKTASGLTKSRLTDLYGADAWAQDADNVLLINGKRTACVRTMSLEKAREAPVGEWAIGFQLDPYPYFGEMIGRGRVGSGPAVKFKGL